MQTLDKTSPESLAKPNPASCEKCSLCCKLLQISPEPDITPPYPGKSWNEWCPSCKPGALPGGCQRYTTRPKACEAFQCIWLQSQSRVDVPTLSDRLKPNNCHAVLVQSQEDYFVMFAYIDPAYPEAWQKEPLRTHLRMVANNGGTVVVVLKDKRLIMTRNNPIYELTEEQVQQLVEIHREQQKGKS